MKEVSQNHDIIALLESFGQNLKCLFENGEPQVMFSFMLYYMYDLRSYNDICGSHVCVLLVTVCGMASLFMRGLGM